MYVKYYRHVLECLTGPNGYHAMPPTFIISNNLCEADIPEPSKSYLSQTPVAFGISGHMTTKQRTAVPC